MSLPSVLHPAVFLSKQILTIVLETERCSDDRTSKVI